MAADDPEPTVFVELKERPPWGVTFEYDARGRLFVAAVEPGGAAERSGLKRDLVLHSVNGKSVLRKKNAVKALKRKPPLSLALFQREKMTLKGAANLTLARLRAEEANLVAQLAKLEAEDTGKETGGKGTKPDFKKIAAHLLG